MTAEGPRGGQQRSPVPAGRWTGQAGCTHQSGVGSDGDQLCPSGAAVLSALLPALFGRGEVVALPRIPEPAGRAELALPCTPEMQPVGAARTGQLAGATTSPQPRGQEGDKGAKRPRVLLWLSHRAVPPLDLAPEPSSLTPAPQREPQGTWTGYTQVLASGRWVKEGSSRFGDVIQTSFAKLWESSQDFIFTRDWLRGRV